MNQAEERPSSSYQVVRVFHPTIQVPDLDQAEHWFSKAFGRLSTSLSEILPTRPEYPTEYSTFTMIRDVLIDSIDPKLHFVNGYQRYPRVYAPSLKGIGWYVDGMEGLYKGLKKQGIRCLDLQDNVAEGEDAPQSPGGGVITYFTLAEDAGMQYQFMRAGAFPLDPRTQPGWKLGPVDAADPLGVDCCSHHTILTSNLSRALRFAVDALGGKVVHQGRNDLLRASSTFVFVADALFEYAEPDVGSLADERLQQASPNDSYFGITWKVSSLDRAQVHLASVGARVQARSSTTIVTDPATSLGVAWGFTEAFQVGDPRGERP